jgi:hypothetical protein
LAITVVGTHGATANTTTTLNLARTAGAVNNLIIVGGSVGNSAAGAFTGATPISDTQANTWNTFTGLPFHDATNGVTVIGWWALAKNTTATTITINSNVASAFMIMMLSEFTGTDITSPLDQVATPRGNSTNPTSATFTPTYNDELIWVFGVDSITAVGNIDGSAATKGSDDTFQDWSEYRILTGRAGVGMTAAFVGGAGAWNLVIGTFKTPSAVATLEQEGFRFRNDDGSETTATFMAAQDTTVTLAPSVTKRIRVLVNATGDPASQTFKLQYRKVGASAWRNVDKFN